MLRASGHSLLSFYRRLSAPPQQTAALEAAEKALRADLQFPGETESKGRRSSTWRPQLILNHAAVRQKPAKSVSTTKSAPVREERQLKFAEALAQSGERARSRKPRTLT